MTPLNFILATLATYRLSHMLAKEDGPGNMILHLRENVRYHSPHGTIIKGLECPLCLSVWFSALCVVFLAATKRLPWSMVVLAWLAVSGGSVAIERSAPKQ